MNSQPSVPTPITEPNNAPIITVTLEAINYIKEYKAKKTADQDKSLRISVEGGGCSGYQYTFSFDTQREDDLVVLSQGEKVLIDPQTRLFIKDSTIDYTDSLGGSGFVVKNPNAKASCGCGVSFSV